MKELWVLGGKWWKCIKSSTYLYMYVACIVNRDWVPDISFHVLLALPHLSQPRTFSSKSWKAPFAVTWGVMAQPDLWSCHCKWHGTTSWILTVRWCHHYGPAGLQALWGDVRADKAMEMRKVRNQVLEESHFLKLIIDSLFPHRIVEMSVRNTFCSKTVC